MTFALLGLALLPWGCADPAGGREDDLPGGHEVRGRGSDLPAGREATGSRVIDLVSLVGTGSTRTAGSGEIETQTRAIDGLNVRAIFQHPPSTLRFEDLEVGGDAFLDFLVGVRDEAWDKGSDGVVFEVLVVGADGDERQVFSRSLSAGDEERTRGWHAGRVALGELEGESIDLILRTSRGSGDDGSYDWAYWGDPIIVSAGNADSALPNVVLISADTQRADFLGAYGSTRGATPVLDALAARGAILLDAIAPSAWTRPSHFSMLTGAYADKQLFHYDQRSCAINPEVVMLQEILATRQFLTAAFTGGGFLGPASGFEQGFHFYRSHGRRLEENLDSILGWLDEHASERFFLFVHHFNAHRPYLAPASHLERFAGETPAQCEDVTFGREDGASGRTTRCLAAPGGPAYLEGRYAAATAHADAQTGVLFDHLDSLGVLDNTIVIVTSDHGDELLERGSLDHIKTLYQEVIQVPLIIAGPGIPAGMRLAGEVSLVDIAPTVMDLLGLDASLGTGRSLVPHLQGSPPDRSRAMAATSFDTEIEAFSNLEFPLQYAVIENGRKLIRRHGAAGLVEELYDLDDDPDEGQDRIETDGNAERLRRLLTSWVDGLAGESSCTPKGADPETLRQLRALGYVN